MFLGLALPLGGGTVAGGGGGADGTLLAISQAISSTGRLGFYVDYAESTDATGPVTHRFYVARTHGTSGAASCSYTSAGDTHTTVSGTLNWGDGSADIKYIDVVVSASDLATHASNGLGEHRIRVTLSSASGAALHFGAAYTIAHGVIDDSVNADGSVNASATMIASDSNAVFFNTAAVTNGSGTAASPYDNPYDAISNVGSKRYIYGRGTVIPDGTNTGTPFGASALNIINAPATRTSEATRLYIRAWPGYSLTVDGNSDTSKCGFMANSNESFHTYRKIDFVDMDATGQSTSAWGIWYHYGTAEGINIELCTGSGIHGSTGSNVAPFQLWGVEGCRVWRCTANNVSVGGSFTNGNSTGIMSFIGDKVSVQRCEWGSNMGVGIYHKTTATDETAFNVKFCIFDDVEMHYGTSSPGHKNIIFCSNLMKGASAIVRHQVDSGLQADNQISNNYFYQSGSGTVGAIHSRRLEDAVVFGNIFDACRGAFYDTVSDATQRYIDYNVTNGVTYEDWQIASTYYSTSAAMNTAVGFGGNDTEGTPLPTNITTNDVTLGIGSAAIGASIGGTDAGVYLTGIEVLGA